MAIVKFIPSRKPQSGGGLHGSMEYCKQEHKTWDEVSQRHLVTGVNCVADTAFREFMNTKRLYEKTTENVLSCDPVLLSGGGTYLRNSP